jgi:hypothetical protein
MITATHPDVVVRLTGTDSNVFALLRRCTKALKAAGHDEDAATLTDQVFASGSFDEALAHMAATVVVS